MIVWGKVIGNEILWFKYWWFGVFEVDVGEKYRFYMMGNVV